MIIPMTEKKHYHSEPVEFQNGHTTIAKPLTIKKLRLLQDLFEEYTDDTRKVQMIIAKLTDENAALAGKPEEQEKLYAKAKADIKKLKAIDWTDVLVRGALIALNSWGVKEPTGKTVDDITQEYIEDNLDVPTLERINEVAGNMDLGELSLKDKDEAPKAPEV